MDTLSERPEVGNKRKEEANEVLNVEKKIEK